MRMRVHKARQDCGLAKVFGIGLGKSGNDLSSLAYGDDLRSLEGDGAVFDGWRNNWQDPARGIDDGHCWSVPFAIDYTGSASCEFVDRVSAHRGRSTKSHEESRITGTPGCKADSAGRPAFFADL